MTRARYNSNRRINVIAIITLLLAAVFCLLIKPEHVMAEMMEDIYAEEPQLVEEEILSEDDLDQSFMTEEILVEEPIDLEIAAEDEWLETGEEELVLDAEADVYPEAETDMYLDAEADFEEEYVSDLPVETAEEEEPEEWIEEQDYEAEEADEYLEEIEFSEEMPQADECLDVEEELSLAGSKEEIVQRITLYTSTTKSYMDYMVFPEEYPTSFQLPEGSSATYTKVGTWDEDRQYETASSAYINITENGLIEALPGYKFEGCGTSGNVATFKVKPNESEPYTVIVTLEDYAMIYFYQLVDEFIDSRICPDMTTMEKVKAIASFIGNEHDYNANYSSPVSMMITGGGDCWASAGLVCVLCERLSIPAASQALVARNEGHRNAVVWIDGECYVVETGYAGKKPRGYSIERIQSYKYTKLNDGTIRLSRFYGIEQDLVIPEEVDGMKVTQIEPEFFQTLSITPRTVYFPSSVTSIDINALSCNNELESIEVAEDNPVYSSIDGVLYDKNAETLIYYPAMKGFEFTVPGGVTTIGENAFGTRPPTGYTEIKVHLPSTIRVLKKGSLYNYWIRNIELPEGIEVIEDGAFRMYPENPGTAVFPASLKTLGDQEYLYIERYVFLNKDTEIEGDLDLHIGDCIFGYSGSTAEAKALQNENVDFLVLDEDGKVSLDASWFKDPSEETYKGEAIEPGLRTDTGAPTILREGTDYTYVYENNIEAGTASIVVTGTGTFKGTVRKSFTIKPKEISQVIKEKRYYYSNLLNEMSYVYNGNPAEPNLRSDVFSLVKGVDYILSYRDNINAGTAYAVVTGSGNYCGSEELSFRIKEAKLPKSEPVPDQDFDGTGYKDIPLVIKGLTENKDYQIHALWVSGEGDYMVRVDGQGNYTGSIEVPVRFRSMKTDDSENENEKDDRAQVQEKDNNTIEEIKQEEREEEYEPVQNDHSIAIDTNTATEEKPGDSSDKNEDKENQEDSSDKNEDKENQEDSSDKNEDEENQEDFSDKNKDEEKQEASSNKNGTEIQHGNYTDKKEVVKEDQKKDITAQENVSKEDPTSSDYINSKENTTVKTEAGQNKKTNSTQISEKTVPKVQKPKTESSSKTTTRGSEKKNKNKEKKSTLYTKQKKITLKKGKSKTIKVYLKSNTRKLKRVKRILFRSSNKKVATVTQSGKIRAKKKGKCWITAKDTKGRKVRIKVVVK